MGLTPASIRPRLNVEKCHNCWEPGHFANRCLGTDRSRCCLKYGKAGHSVGECTLCVQPHRAWSGKCGRMKAFLNSARRESIAEGSEMSTAAGMETC
ncbi:unnamed protein product [Brassicogethes aeneus]|uniref:CCHC-type domain-containing protein n=1 Tax=Brassicogethes aeneus TaxID=1431903 RepID=A0A9P0BH50_BRAAE|nr:unnamed protein product [Brassicogethes aeneus]